MIIHGKGRNGEGVLKREVRAYLERHRKTGAMGYAKGPDGGRGALWVMLRTGGRSGK
jgi:DNA-nicking Smr family endonuclease